MSKIHFQYRQHPGDFFRNTEISQLPDPSTHFENFIIQFLKHYQSDQRVAHIDDLQKYIDDEFYNEEEKNIFTKSVSSVTIEDIKAEIKHIEIELKNEAFENFYNLILTNQLKIIENGIK
jgi:hypothetical protein